MKEAVIRRGDWIDPDAGAVLVADFGATWIEERPGLRPKTVTLYRYLLARSHRAHFATVTIISLIQDHREPVLIVVELARDHRSDVQVRRGTRAEDELVHWYAGTVFASELGQLRSGRMQQARQAAKRARR